MNNRFYLYVSNKNGERKLISSTPFVAEIFDYIFISCNPICKSSINFDDSRTEIKTMICSNYDSNLKIYLNFIRYLINNYKTLLNSDFCEDELIDTMFFEEMLENSEEFFENLKEFNPIEFQLETYDILALYEEIEYKEQFNDILNTAKIIHIEIEKLLKNTTSNSKIIEDTIYNFGLDYDLIIN